MNQRERNLFALAENLGMTVSRLKSEMTMSEYLQWLEYYSDDKKDAPVPAEKAPQALVAAFTR